MMSAVTGYEISSWQGAPTGPMYSLYEMMRQQNLCMHRDYQNIGVNGARVDSVNSSLVRTLARKQYFDQPMIVHHQLIGNDVCNGHPGLQDMTEPPQFYRSVTATLSYLDTILPPGSHVVFMGLVDGRILWELMANRTHPLGAVRNDVTYAAVYEYLMCLGITPCWGWLNPNETVRNLTSERAANLSAVYNEIIANNSYNNFDMVYFDYPLAEMIQRWVQQGGNPSDAIEPVDGFHPSQTGNAMLAQTLWELYQQKAPYLIPPINPNNQFILQQFGSQGGYNTTTTKSVAAVQRSAKK